MVEWVVTSSQLLMDDVGRGPKGKVSETTSPSKVKSRLAVEGRQRRQSPGLDFSPYRQGPAGLEAEPRNHGRVDVDPGLWH